jgi:hypothetical protein
MQLQGLVGSDKYGYYGIKSFCTSNLTREYFVLNWGYVPPGDDFIPTDAVLKEAIYKNGPIASGVQTTAEWDTYRKLDEYGNPRPDWSRDFPNGIAKGIKHPRPAQIDHEVLIVGWDDTLGVWIIKNSWGTYWGDDGFMKLPYGCNNLGFGASWVTVNPISVSSPTSETLRLNSRNDLLLKFYPQMLQQLD